MIKSIFIKLLICSIFVFMLSTSFCMSSSYALGDIFSQGKEFLEAGNDIDDTINTTQLEKTSDYIYNTLLGIAIMVAIIVGMILGIQFMAASADEKAKVKEGLMPYIVGCIVVFGAFTIWKVVVNIGNKAEDSISASGPSYSSIGDVKEALEKDDQYLNNMSDNEIKDLYDNVSQLYGPFLPEDSAVIQKITDEYNERFGSTNEKSHG